MKFLHTSDWQMEMSAAQFGEKAEAVREARFTALERIMKLAKERDVEFIVVAGDVFDTLDVTPSVVQRVALICSTFGKPVYLLPGNHDPAVANSLWFKDDLWREAPKVSRMLRPEAITVCDGVTIFPTPLDRKRESQDLTAWLGGVPTSGIRIGVAHGGLLAASVGSPNFPIARDAVTRYDLDYLALGDWHSFAAYPDETNVARTVYSGTHEQTAFNDRDPGNVVIVEIGEHGAAPKIERVPVGVLSWHNEIIQEPTREALDERLSAIRALQPFQRHLVRLRISGTLRADALDVLAQLQLLQSVGFFLFELTDETRMAPDNAQWIESLPAGAVRDAAHALLAEAGEDEAATEALHLLYGFSGNLRTGGAA